MHWKQYNTNQTLWSTDSRAIIGRTTADIRRLSADGSLIKYNRPTYGRLTPDDRATFGRYHGEIIFKKSADCLPIMGRPSPNASPMAKPIKIGGSVNETFNLGASTKKSSADQKICQKWCRRRSTISRRRPFFPFLAHQPSGDRRFG